MHLDEERLQRLLDGEPDPAGGATQRHVAECATCRSLVEEARAEERRIFDLLRLVDHPLPAVDPRAVLLIRASSPPRWARWAAGIVLTATLAGAAYAAPGSPLPRVLGRLIALVVPAQGRSPEAPPERAPAAAAGIAMAPGDGLVIQFVHEGDGAAVTISLTDGEEVVVRAVEGVATFTSDVNRLSVRSTGRARFETLIPRTAPRVEVLAGGTPVFRRLATRTVTVVQPDSAGRYTVPLPPASP